VNVFVNLKAKIFTKKSLIKISNFLVGGKSKTQINLNVLERFLAFLFCAAVELKNIKLKCL
jgi:hypothetical protein